MRRRALLVLLAVLALGGARGATAQSLVVTYPATVALPPFGAVRFVQPQSRESPRPPALPLRLDVVSRSDRPTTATYDGVRLVIVAPPGVLVRFVSGCAPADANPASCSVIGCGQLCLRPDAPPGLGEVVFTTV